MYVHVCTYLGSGVKKKWGQQKHVPEGKQKGINKCSAPGGENLKES